MSYYKLYDIFILYISGLPAISYIYCYYISWLADVYTLSCCRPPTYRHFSAFMPLRDTRYASNIFRCQLRHDDIFAFCCAVVSYYLYALKMRYHFRCEEADLFFFSISLPMTPIRFSLRSRRAANTNAYAFARRHRCAAIYARCHSALSQMFDAIGSVFTCRRDAYDIYARHGQGHKAAPLGRADYYALDFAAISLLLPRERRSSKFHTPIRNTCTLHALIC